MQAVAISPVSVGVDASHPEFLFYKSGIFDHLPCNDTELGLTHAITAVGYGEEDGVGYWIVRNQWSTTWGDEGYIKMAMGKVEYGLCGMRTWHTSDSVVNTKRCQIEEACTLPGRHVRVLCSDVVLFTHPKSKRVGAHWIPHTVFMVT